MTEQVFRPDADPESTSVDGQSHSGLHTAWADAVGTATGGYADDNNAGLGMYSTYYPATAKYRNYRSWFLFDTSSLGAGAIVNTAKVELYALPFPNKTNSDGTAVAYAAICTSTPASNTAITTADYDQVGTAEVSDRLTLPDITEGAYNTFTLNDMTVISKTGVTKLAVRVGCDFLGSAPAGANSCTWYAAEQGTAYAPKLTVNYTLPAGWYNSNII